MQLEFGGALQRCCDTCNKVNIFNEVTNVHFCLVTETYGCSIRNSKINDNIFCNNDIRNKYLEDQWFVVVFCLPTNGYSSKIPSCPQSQNDISWKRIYLHSSSQKIVHQKVTILIPSIIVYELLRKMRLAVNHVTISMHKKQFVRRLCQYPQLDEQPDHTKKRMRAKDEA